VCARARVCVCVDDGCHVFTEINFKIYIFVYTHCCINLLCCEFVVDTDNILRWYFRLVHIILNYLRLLSIVSSRTIRDYTVAYVPRNRHFLSFRILFSWPFICFVGQPLKNGSRGSPLTPSMRNKRRKIRFAAAVEWTRLFLLPPF